MIRSRENTTRRYWKQLENQAVREGTPRAEAKMIRINSRRMFKYGGTVVFHGDGTSTYYAIGEGPGEDFIVQTGVGVDLYARELLDDITFAEKLAAEKNSASINALSNEIMFQRLQGKQDDN